MQRSSPFINNFLPHFNKTLYFLPIGVSFLVMFLGFSALLPINVTASFIGKRLHLLFFLFSMATYIHHFGLWKYPNSASVFNNTPRGLIDFTLWCILLLVCIYYSQASPSLTFGLYLLVLILCLYNSLGPQILIGAIGCLGVVYYSLWHILATQSFSFSTMFQSVWAVERLTYQTLFANPEQGVLGALFSILEIKIAPFILLNAHLRTPQIRRAILKVAHTISRPSQPSTTLLANTLVPLSYGVIATSALQNMREIGHRFLAKHPRSGSANLFYAGLQVAACIAGQIMPPFLGVALLAQVSLFNLNPFHTLAIACGMAFCFILSLLLSIAWYRYFSPYKNPKERHCYSAPRLLDWLECLKLILAPIATLLLWIIGFDSNTAACMVTLGLCFWILATGGKKKLRRLTSRWHEAGVIISTQIVFSPLLSLCLNIARETQLYNSLYTLLPVLDSPPITWFWIALMCIMIGKNLPTLPAYVTAATLLRPILEAMPNTMLSNLIVTYWLVAANSLPGAAFVAQSAASALQLPSKKVTLQGALSAVGLWVLPIIFLNHPALLTPVSAPFLETAWSVLIMVVFFSIWMQTITPEAPSLTTRLLKWALLPTLLSPFSRLQIIGLCLGLASLIRVYNGLL